MILFFPWLRKLHSKILYEIERGQVEDWESKNGIKSWLRYNNLSGYNEKAVFRSSPTEI